MAMRYRGRGRPTRWSGACMRPILRGSGRWEGKSAGPGGGDLEVGDDRTGDSQQSGQELNRVPTLLASGAQNAGKDLLGGGPPPGEVAAPGLAIHHGGADGSPGLVVGGRHARQGEEAEEGAGLPAEMLDQPGIGRIFGGLTQELVPTAHQGFDPDPGGAGG